MRTLDQATQLQQSIESAIGARYQRPLGDIWNNFGLMSQSGDFDHKIIENVTNAQDAILELEAQKKYANLTQVPHQSPQEAATALLAGQSVKDLERRIHVDFYEPDDLADKRVTVAVRDNGCGMEPAAMPSTVFRLGSSHKSEIMWQQGAFGLGAKSTFRNARAVVVVTRRAPEMSPSQDRIAVAVVLWEPYGKGTNAYYLTTSDWADGENQSAEPWSAPPSDFPEFEPGTYIALISYGVRGLHRRYSGDERAFHAIAQTRLYQPVVPFRHTSHLIKKPEPRTVRGLAEALDSGTEGRRHGVEPMPFHLDGTTYTLPVSWWVFPDDANKKGGRDSLVAAQHVCVFTSGGQVHKHWNAAEFRERTRLTKLDKRIFVVVDTDELPITVRTSLFTPDRSDLVPTDDSIRLEEAVVAHLEDSLELNEINAALIRAEIEKALGRKNTRAVAQRISRAFKLRGGFSLGSGKKNGRKKRPRKPKKKMDLYTEPTFIEGPERITVRPGDTRSLTYYINAKDEFMDSGRGTLDLTCENPSIQPGRELAVGSLRGGCLRVALAVPETAELGNFKLAAQLPEWAPRNGGLAGPLHWETQVVVTDEPPPPPKPPKPAGAEAGGGEIALLWTSGDGWGFTPNVPGVLDNVSASLLAEQDDYSDLAKLGDQDITTIVINEDFADYKKYVSGLVKRRGTTAVDQNKDRYAQGVGVGLLVIDEHAQKHDMNDQQRGVAVQAVARATLSLLPAFDEIMSRIDDA